MRSTLASPVMLGTANEKKDVIGITRGLAWTEYGGETLDIEAVALPGRARLSAQVNWAK